MGRLENIRMLEDALKVRMLTCEAEILFFLKEHADQKIRDLCDLSKYSHVTIHDCLSKLVGAGIIQKSAHDADGRRVQYLLTPTGDNMLEDFLKEPAPY